MSSHARLKTLAVNVLDASGIGWLLRPLYAGRGAILGLHRVLPADQPTLVPGNVVTVPQLRAALRFLRLHNYEIVSLDELPERLRRQSSRRIAAITLDDGYLDNLLFAAPVCREFDAPFCVFATTGFIGRITLPWWILLEEYILANDSIELNHPSGRKYGFSCATYAAKTAAFQQLTPVAFANPAAMLQALTRAYLSAGLSVAATVDRTVLSWDQLTTLSRDPLATIGAHTVSHPLLSNLSESEARSEIEESRQELQMRLGAPVRHVAYPFGSSAECGPREFRLAEELGFATGVTSMRGTLRGPRYDLFGLPRIALSAVPHAASLRYLRVCLNGVWNGPANWWRRRFV
jgi:peptidoglycan/xylan/chitin deacetylase (PgdA/CDA1 family)